MEQVDIERRRRGCLRVELVRAPPRRERSRARSTSLPPCLGTCFSTFSFLCCRQVRDAPGVVAVWRECRHGVETALELYISFGYEVFDRSCTYTNSTTQTTKSRVSEEEAWLVVVCWRHTPAPRFLLEHHVHVSLSSHHPSVPFRSVPPIFFSNQQVTCSEPPASTGRGRRDWSQSSRKSAGLSRGSGDFPSTTSSRSGGFYGGVVSFCSRAVAADRESPRYAAS